MKLIFVGNDYKYEIEGVMKLFIPASLFDLSYPDNVPKSIEGDYALIVREKNDDDTHLQVSARVGGNTQTRSGELLNTTPDYDNECELLLSKLLFGCMKELTGITPGWGVITGVRPVKQVNKLIDKGLGDDEIREYMHLRYLCSDKKTDIAIKTAHTQSDILKTLDKRSFGLYVSIPFCPTRCSYCSFVSTTTESSKSLIPQYVALLCQEIEHTAKICEKAGIYPDSIYFGGGTPTTLSASQLRAVMGKISDCFDMSHVREYTVEAGRPDTITPQKLHAIKEMGAGRVSINPQSLSDKVLENIGRKHTVSQFFDALEMAQQTGFECINTDIIAGLPGDDIGSFRNTVDTLISKALDNITVHTLSIKRAARLNHEGTADALKNPAGEMIDYATDSLIKNGYAPYYLYRQKNMLENQENIGWSKPGKESLYNICIMEEVQTIIAVGAGGSTKLVDRDGGRLERIFNYKYPYEYIKGFDEILKRKNGVESFYEEK
ncbi:MAG: coproporphyrinogen dehydrogenase HemZ [Ruminococcus sp.]|nr:coproporphyrinogen dehydrogenase HemZ [Ruminococcus sp.]